MTTNETSFCRDARVFTMLARSILPALVANRSAERSRNSTAIARCHCDHIDFMLRRGASDFHGRITGQEYRVDLNTSK